MKQKLLQAMVVLLASIGTLTQVSSGSNGAFHPTTKTVIHPPRHL